MLIDIYTNDPVFAETVANVLRDSGHAVLVRHDGTESYGLQHAPGLPADELVGLLEALAPLAPLPVINADLSLPPTTRPVRRRMRRLSAAA